MQISQVIDQIRATPDCVVFAPTGQPIIRVQHVLPVDVQAFYAICGGLILFQSIAFPLTILPPERFVLANPEILGTGAIEMTASEGADDISWDWYTIADDSNGDYFTIDLHPKRLGHCYDSFHETHAMQGETPIVALSFTDFVSRMRQLILDSAKRNDVESRWHWRDMTPHLTLGDAYDQE